MMSSMAISLNVGTAFTGPMYANKNDRARRAYGLAR